MINNENIEYLTSVRVDLLEGDIGGRKERWQVGDRPRYVLKDNRFLPRLLLDVNSCQCQPHWFGYTISNK